MSGATSALAASDTLGITDQIDGGAGADTLSLTMGKSFAGFQTNAGWLKNVETVNLTNTTPTVYSFAAKGVSGVTQYTVTGPVDVTSIDSLSTKVTLKSMNTFGNASNTAITVSYSDTLTSGSSDSATIGIETLGRASSSSTDVFDFTSGSGATVNLTVPSIENLTLETTGNNYLSLAGSAAVKALTATGSGTLVIDGNANNAAGTNAVPGTLRTVDASSRTGATSIDLTGRADGSNNMTSIKTGSGDDLIQVDEDSLRADATVSGGDGTDTFFITRTSGNFAATAYSMSGVETIRIGAGTSTVDLSLSGTSGLKTIRVDNGQSGNVTFTGGGATDLTVELRGHATATSDGDALVSVETTGAGNVTFAGTTTAAAPLQAEDSLIFTKSGSVSVTIGENYIFAPQTAGRAGVNAAEATSVTISGDGYFNDGFTSTTDSGLIVPKATSLTINQTSTTSSGWNVGIVSDTTTPVLKNLSVTTKSVNAITLESDDLANKDAFENLETLTVDTATHFDFDDNDGVQYNLAKITSLTLSGTTNSSQVTLGDLGGTSLAYGINLTATGLKGGLTATDIAVGAGQAITLNLKGLQDSTAANTTTALAIGSLTEGASSTAVLNGSVTVDGAGMGYEGAVTIGTTGDAIYAKTVNIDLSGSSIAGALIIAGNGAEITGETVTIKTPTAPSSAVVGTLNVKSAFTYVGPTTVAETGGMTINTTGSAFTGTLTTGLGDDGFTVTGGASTASFTVSGDLKDGADTLTLSAAAFSTGTGGVSITVKDLLSTNAVITGSGRADTIVTGAGNDRITGGAGADTLTGGAGRDLFTYNAPTEASAAFDATTVTRSGNPVSIVSGTYVVTANDFISTSGIDKITDFSSGDVIQIINRADPNFITLQSFGQLLGTGKSLASSLSGQAVDAVSRLGAGAAASYDYFILGNYDSSANRFTFSSGGADTLYVFDDGKDADFTDLHAIVLVGYTAGGAALTTAPTGLANYTGLNGASLIG